MRKESGQLNISGGWFPWRVSGSLVGLMLVFALLVSASGEAFAGNDWPKMASSADGTAISYETYGAGTPALVFVHGWSCDARYWWQQTAHFADRHRVVVLDLAGHGHSGSGRTRYTMASFGEDVRAVMDAEGIEDAILVGHSMGGSVIVEAARLLPKRVRGLIGVDTLENIEYPLTREAFYGMVAPLEQDFPAGTREFVAQMISPQTDPRLRDWILADMSAAPPAVALSALRETMQQYLTGEVAKLFEEVRLPVVTINADVWPINYEGNRRHMLSYEAIVIEGADHFLMMNRPGEFNVALEKAVGMLPGP